MQAAEIRKAFLDFFQGKEHLLVPSSSLIPAGDPTLLLTSAGMVQFKPYFTGEMTPPQPRLTSVQKCFRVSDVDSVGDTSHLTFFEMLGNFSVGDYFKKEAIAWGWEFVTKHMKLPPERLWATVFRDDDEAYALWQETGIPASRIRRFEEKDNFWGPAGDEGPCGPCSEIHYDFGGACRLDKSDADCGPNCQCGRFLELWNLVFMQFYQDKGGKRTHLPRPNIDTGMGLERAALILQGVASIYETDLFVPIVQRVCELANKTYGQDAETDRAIRVVAEHARAAAFLIADGVVPSNEGRGYVLRRLIRRAIFFGMQLGRYQPVSAWDNPSGVWTIYMPGPKQVSLAEVAKTVIRLMGYAYPELRTNELFLLKTLSAEEEAFQRTLKEGDVVLRQIVGVRELIHGYWNNPQNLRAALEGWKPLPTIQREVLNPLLEDKGLGRLSRDAVLRIAGHELFLLHSTYGFPMELTREAVKTYSRLAFTVDEEGFNVEMGHDQQRSRAASGFGTGLDAVRVYQELGVDGTRFLGYETTSAPSVTVALLVNGVSSTIAEEGQQAEVILRETPFYAEGGGQAGDTGVIEAPGWYVQVEDTQSPIAGLMVHKGKVVRGTAQLGEMVTATVDRERRMDCARNHTATHLLHAALRQVLGTHVRQQGSLVAPDRLRFDFTHVSPLSPEELRQVEALVNDRIRANLPVHKRETTYRQAVAEGALAFFGERYGDRVRVVEVSSGLSLGVPHHGEPARGAGGVGQAPFSYEVCGGTHVEATGEIGYCHVLGESSVGAGLRRIEAVTGRAAEAFVRGQEAALNRLARQLETSPQELEAKVASLMEEVARLRRELASHQRASSRQQAQALLDKVQVFDGVKVASGIASIGSVEALREVGDWLRDKLGSGVVVLGALVNDSPTLLVMVTKDLVARGLHAGNIVKEAAKVMGGGGGGRPEMAQAGGRDPAKLEDTLRAAVEAVKRQASKANPEH